jgi:hypothetical protein
VRVVRIVLVVVIGLVSSPKCAVADVTIVREPVYALDARAIVGANRVIARTRFRRAGSSPLVHELAVAAGERQGAGDVPKYERFFRSQLAAFLRAAAAAGIRTDDAGDARAYFIQAAFKVYDGQGFGDPRGALSGPGLWGEGAIAGMASASASLARMEFRLRVKFVMGRNPRFARLSDAGKQRVYDFYAVATELLIAGYVAAAGAGDRREVAFVRRQAKQQLKADLGVDPDRVRFTAAGIVLE